MKKLAFLLLLAPLTLWAQDSPQDTARTIVERYLKMLNYEALPTDSTLVLETTVTFHGSTDSYTLRRWYAPPTMMRIEVWHGDTLTTGLCTNGSGRHREYSRHNGWWNDVDHSLFHQHVDAYDFHSPLYNWEMRGITLKYKGTTELKGQQLEVVQAHQKDSYVRYYMFEKQSGLLVLMQERDEDTTSAGIQSLMKALTVKPIDYKVIHEYLPVGESLIKSQESYMRDGVLTIMNTTARFEPRNNLLFNQD